ncbi:hypothetical protein GGX14DRAFT_672205 [Mycena pura]|uniref:Uncharacterized protein n=1 Tax=Mycena pura TaxID=153505 RepID=A0AAD6Y4T4_9AGAR|nr:hypothetical protein GGX14DRAFT_672205 [Mycena pura]
MSRALGCAQNADGSLTDAADIVWHNDPRIRSLIKPTASNASPGTAVVRRHVARPVHTSLRSAWLTRTMLSKVKGKVALANGAQILNTGEKHKAPAAAAHKAKVMHIESPVASDDETEAVSADDDGAEDAATEPADSDVEENVDYESLKSMADTDHVFLQRTAKLSRSLSEPTADLNTVFNHIKGHKNPRTGVLENGAICNVCVHTDHFAVYKKHCAEAKIDMHPRAIPADRSDTVEIVVAITKPPTFTVDGLRDFLGELLITADLVRPLTYSQCRNQRRELNFLVFVICDFGPFFKPGSI